MTMNMDSFVLTSININTTIYSPNFDDLTPNQRRDLLFNIKQPLELSTEEFDTEYTRKDDIPSDKRRKTKVRPSEAKVRIERFENLPDHTHTLDNIEKIKRSQVVRNLVEQESLKDYRPPAILNAVKEYAKEKLNLDESMKELKHKEVTNIKYKVRGSLDAHLIGNPKRSLDIQESISFLEQQKYKVERYSIPHNSSMGLVFINQNQIKNLEKYGWLTLIDSTHKTNRYDYRLFTLYVRNGYGCQDVGAHFFVSKEDGITVAEALKKIRRFVLNWKSRYILQDQSSIEENSIRIVFPGLKMKMTQVMYKRSKIGCEALIQQAINECPVPAIKRYISRNYTKNSHQWALWARTHSPLLLQVISTNSLESYYSELKRTTSQTYGLIGACNRVVMLDQKKQSDSEYVGFEFRIKKISVVGLDHEILDELHKFPYPVQQMLADEACGVEKRIEKGKAAPGLTSLDCNCLFHLRYLLPCRHIFHEHIYGTTKLLTADTWRSFQQIFEENGFDIYMHHEVVEVDISEKDKAEGASKHRQLVVNELMERTRDVYWRIEERGDEKQTGAFIRDLKSRLEPILYNASTA
ncbi:hypothetical protein C2G38_2195574 [Gigaspora rosea]|uniref:ZSWIM1/3 RNaseH-like domain-containing protein n=1 Tax=Gigaspora rosea TaxID=44941 RepID=A0A397UY29_9GLOM|nr:hypothetical protein C2G38_2195574 [Gigaspora rosea]